MIALIYTGNTMTKQGVQNYGAIRERESKTRSALFTIPSNKAVSLARRRIMILSALVGALSF